MNEELEKVIRSGVNEIFLTRQDKMSREEAIRAKSMEIAAIIIGETKDSRGPETADKAFIDYLPLANRIGRYISGNFEDRLRERLAETRRS
jgi:hypothetical protein